MEFWKSETLIIVQDSQRNQFVPIFGKAQPFKREQAADNEQRRKVVVTERRPMQK